MAEKECLYCKEMIPEEALFCPFCGKEQKEDTVKIIEDPASEGETDSPHEPAEETVEVSGTENSVFASTEMDESEAEAMFSIFEEDKPDKPQTVSTAGKVESQKENDEEPKKEAQKKPGKESAGNQLLKRLGRDTSKKEEKPERSARPPRRKRHDTPEPVDASEEEEENSDAGSASGFSYEEEGILKDEVASKKKNEEAKKKEEEGDTREGRRKVGRDKAARKNIDRLIANRKVEEIEHEKTVAVDEEDKDYDGYYESVLPIDYDKMRDNSIYVKVGITAAAFFLLASGLFYLIIRFFTL